MGRKKIEMGLIGNTKKRTMTFNKRKTMIMKKAYELSTLCDIPVCVIIYGNNGEKPYVWPEEPDRFNSVLTRYLNTPLEERKKRALKLSSMLEKSKKDRVLDTGSNDKQVGNLPSEQQYLSELYNRLDYKIGIVQGRIDAMKMDEERKSMIMYQNSQYEYQNQNQYGYQCTPPQNYTQLLLEDSKKGMETIKSTTNMTVSGDFRNLDNDNVNVGDCNNGSMGRSMINGIPWDPTTLTLCPNAQVLAQDYQFNGSY